MVKNGFVRKFAEKREIYKRLLILYEWLIGFAKKLVVRKGETPAKSNEKAKISIKIAIDTVANGYFSPIQCCKRTSKKL